MTGKKKLRVFPPWDLLRGRDVFRDSFLLREELDSALVQHWAPNCGTFSRARERPIPGVANAPVPLRSDKYPKGIPSVLRDLPPAKRRKVELDTSMAEMAAIECLSAHKSGRYFSLENPKNSIARCLESWEELEKAEGVFSTEYHACMFRECRRRKSQILIHNIPHLKGKIGKLCPSSGRCKRTGLPHLSWKPRVVGGKVTSFATSDEREYPAGFCEEYAAAIKSMKDLSSATFLEVFSGENAPLSVSVAAVWGVPLPKPEESLVGQGGKFVEFSEPTPRELPEGLQAGVPAIDTPEIPGASNPENSHYREAAVQAGKQPSYGKRRQLVPDGLQSPSKHLEVSKKLSHPFDSLQILKSDHRRALEAIKSSPQELVNRRFESLDMIKKWELELRVPQKEKNKGAAWTARKLGCKPNTLLMERLQELLLIEDTRIPDLCLSGLRITGEASQSPFFDTFIVPPSMSGKEFFSSMRERSLRMVERVKFMAQKGDPALAKAIWEKTQKEVRKGTMGPPLTLEQVVHKYGHDFQVTPSFGLEQGVDESGAPKFRRIDDYTASGVNPSAHRMQKVPMCMIDYIGVMIRAAAEISDSVSFATDDMASAYRQVPLAPADVKYAITGVYDPTSQKVWLHEMYGQPFGAGHAVPNFCRIAEWLARCLQRLFHIHIDHFFDDFFIVEPPATIRSAIHCMRESFKLLGFTLDPEKSQGPSPTCAILGIVFDTTSLDSQGVIRMVPKPSRVHNLQRIIDLVLKRRELSPSLAASMVGKFGFLCSTLFGKVGRCCTGPLRQRQYSALAFHKLSSDMIISLNLMRSFLSSAPSRELRLRHRSPILLYTDASDVPDRSPQRLLGAFLFDPLDGSHLYSSWPVPNEVVAKWIPKKS